MAGHVERRQPGRLAAHAWQTNRRFRHGHRQGERRSHGDRRRLLLLTLEDEAKFSKPLTPTLSPAGRGRLSCGETENFPAPHPNPLPCGERETTATSHSGGGGDSPIQAMSVGPICIGSIRKVEKASSPLGLPRNSRISLPLSTTR